MEMRSETVWDSVRWVGLPKSSDGARVRGVPWEGVFGVREKILTDEEKQRIACLYGGDEMTFDTEDVMRLIDAIESAVVEKTKDKNYSTEDVIEIIGRLKNDPLLEGCLEKLGFIRMKPGQVVAETDMLIYECEGCSAENQFVGLVEVKP